MSLLCLFVKHGISFGSACAINYEVRNFNCFISNLNWRKRKTLVVLLSTNKIRHPSWDRNFYSTPERIKFNNFLFFVLILKLTTALAIFLWFFLSAKQKKRRKQLIKIFKLINWRSSKRKWKACRPPIVERKFCAFKNEKLRKTRI